MVYVSSIVCVPYLTTPGTVVAVLTGSATRLDASAARHVAALPCCPGRPVDMRRAGQVFITVPGQRRSNDSRGSVSNVTQKEILRFSAMESSYTNQEERVVFSVARVLWRDTGAIVALSLCQESAAWRVLHEAKITFLNDSPKNQPFLYTGSCKLKKENTVSQSERTVLTRCWAQVSYDTFEKTLPNHQWPMIKTTFGLI